MKPTFLPLALAVMIAAMVCAGNVQAQMVTNLFGTNVTFTTSWNFIVAASNLTAQEKDMFNERANAMQGLPFMGMYGVDQVAAQVKALDAQREVEKILERVRLMESTLISTTTTVEWVGHPAVRVDHPQYQNVNYPAHLPDVEMGLRSDGVIIWRQTK